MRIAATEQHEASDTAAPDARRRLRHRPFIVLLLLGWAGLATAAGLDSRLRLDIPAQPLGPALTELAQQAHIQIVVSAHNLGARSAPAVRGTMRVGDALLRLLAGSGLSYRAIGAGTVAVSAAPTPDPPAPPVRSPPPGTLISSGSDAPVSLAPVQVTGSGEVRATSTLSGPQLRTQTTGYAPQRFLNLLPGVDAQTTDPLGLYEFGTSLRIRGFSADQLAITLDGVPLEETLDTRDDTPPNRYVDADDLEELSVAQGSADLATPSFHALGGSVRYQTRAPQGIGSARASATGGSDALARAAARLESGPLWAGGPYGALGASTTRAGQDGNPDADMRVERVQFKAVQALQHGKLGLSAYHGDRDDHDVGTYLADGSVDVSYSRTYSGDPARDARWYRYWRNGRSDTLLTLRAEFQPTVDSTVVVQPYYEHKSGYGTAGIMPDAAQNLYQSAVDASPQRSDIQPPDADHPSGRLETLNGDRQGLTLGLERQLQRHRLQLGGWVQRYHFAQLRPLYRMEADGRLLTEQLPVTVYYDRRIDTEVLQFFVKDSLSLANGRATLELGSKGLTVTRDASGYLNNSAFNQGLQESRSKQDQDLLQPQLGLVWHASQDTELFANYAENFSATPRLAFVSESFNQGLEPETSHNLDIGLRAAGQRHALAIAIYYIDYRNRVLALTSTDPDFVGVDTFENVGAIETTGVEGSAYWNPDRHWRLGTSLSVNRSQFQDNYAVYDAELGSRVVASAGKRVPATPSLMAGTEIGWRHDGWYAGIDAKYTGPRYGDTLNTERVGGTLLLNLHAGHERPWLGGSQLHTQINVYNLLDRDSYGAIEPGEQAGIYYRGVPLSLYLSLGIRY